MNIRTKNISIRDYTPTPSKNSTPQSSKAISPTTSTPPRNDVASTPAKPKSDSVQISPAAQQAYKKELEKPTVQTRVNAESTSAGGGSSSKPTNDKEAHGYSPSGNQHTNSSSSNSKADKDKEAYGMNYKGVGVAAAVGAGREIYKSTQIYNEKSKTAQAASKINQNLGPRVPKPDTVGSGIRGGLVGVGVYIGAETIVKPLVKDLENAYKQNGVKGVGLELLNKSIITTPIHANETLDNKTSFREERREKERERPEKTESSRRSSDRMDKMIT